MMICTVNHLNTSLFAERHGHRITSQWNFEMKMMKAFATLTKELLFLSAALLLIHSRAYKRTQEMCVDFVWVSVIFIKILLNKPRKMNKCHGDFCTLTSASLCIAVRVFTPKISMHFKLHTSVTYLHVIFHLNYNHYNGILSCVFACLFVCFRSFISQTISLLLQTVSISGDLSQLKMKIYFLAGKTIAAKLSNNQKDHSDLMNKFWKENIFHKKK